MTEVSQYYAIDSYKNFLQTEGVPVFEGFSVDCLAIPLEPWSRLGGQGAYVHVAGRGDYVSLYVAEIPAGGELKPEKHLHDELIYVLQGRGATTVELPDGGKHSFEWGPGSIFGIPLNAAHQHFNGSGSEPTRFAALTDLPIILNLFHNVNFVYDNAYSFRERAGEERYFRGEGEFRPVKPGRHQWETNFVPNLSSFELPEWKERGAGGSAIQFALADSTMHAHISQFPAGTYKKAHRHMADYHIFTVTGHGYSLLWREGEDPLDTVRIDWGPGVVYAPPDDYFHQHFNTAAHPSRYLALAFGGVRYPVLEIKRRGYEVMDQSVKEGGIQIEYEDEDPRILGMYEAELARHGVPSRMREITGRK